MTSVGSVSIELSLDSSKFQRDLQACGKTALPPINVTTQLDTTQLERGLRSLPQTAVNLDVNLNTLQLERQFRDIKNGDYGAIDVELSIDAKAFERKLKNLSKSLVEPVSVEVSPNIKGFQEKLKTLSTIVIDCLDICIDPDIEGFRRKLDVLYKLDIDCIPVDICFDLDGFAKKIKRLRGQASLDVNPKGIERDLESAVRKGIRAGLKNNIFDSIGGALFKTVTAAGGLLAAALFLPIKAVGAVALTVFTGAGLKLGDQLSSGVTIGLSNSVEKSLQNTVGSTKLLGEKIGEGIIEGISEVLKSQKLPIQGLFEGINLQDAVRSIVGEKEVYTESASARNIGLTSQARKERAAKSQLQREFDSAISNKPRADALKAKIEHSLPDLNQKSSDFASRYQIEQQKLRERAERNINIAFTPESLFEFQVVQYERQVEQFKRQISRLETSGDREGANRARTALSAFSVPRRDAIDEKAVKTYNEQITIQARNQYVSGRLQKKFGVEKAALDRDIAEFNRLQKEYITLAEPIGRAHQGLNALGVDSNRQSIPPLAHYEAIAQEVAQLSNVKIPQGRLPSLTVSTIKPGQLGTYDPRTNQINVSKETYELIQAGKLEAKTVETLVHELRHAVQFDFGQKDAASNTKLKLETATPTEVQKLGRRIEGSVEAQPLGKEALVRQLETDAYVFTERNAARIQQGLNKQNAVSNFESSFGLGGAKADLQLKRLQAEQIKKIQQINQLAVNYGVDLQAEIQSALTQLNQAELRLEPLLEKARHIEALPTEQIENIQKEIQFELSLLLDDISRQSENIKKALIQKKQGVAVVAQPELEARVNQLTRKQLNPVAKKLGITSKGKSTDVLKSEILATNSSELEAALPAAIAVVSDGVKREANALSKLSVDELKTRATSISAAIKQSELKTKDLSGKDKTAALKQLLDTLEHERQLLKEVLTRELNDDARKYLRSYQANLGKSRKKNNTEFVKLVAEQAQPQQSLVTSRLIGNLSQGANSFDQLASFDDVVNTLNEAKRKLLETFSKTTKEQILEKAEVAANSFKQVSSKLQELEQDNSPVVLQDVSPNIKGVKSELGRILRDPLGYLRQRSNNAIVSKARYITENAEGIAGLVDSAVGARPTPQQGKAVQSLQQNFGRLGEAADKFGQNATPANFKQLKASVQALEGDLFKLGIPFQSINHQIDAFKAKLLELQKVGHIPIDIDIEGLVPEKFNLVNEAVGQFANFGQKAIGVISGMVSGFLAFQGVFILQDFLRQISVNAFNAYVQLDKLRTTLDFASGGQAQGSNNLAFVNQQVSDLKIPLQASVEGFTQLAAAARGTTLQGKGVQEVFAGVANASTVLNLSSDQTKSVINALSQTLSKGRVQSEELRLQLSEALPGAMDIAARAMGVTTAQLNKMLESGQIISTDFLPRFGKQLQNEFSDAAKTASNNAQSAIFDLQNSFLTFQQKLGAGLSPVAIVGIKVLSLSLKAAASIALELELGCAAIATALISLLVPASLKAVAGLLSIEATGKTLIGVFKEVAVAINTSKVAVATVGIFAIIEAVRLLSDAVNTDLIQSLDKAAESAKLAAEASTKAFEQKPGGRKKSEGLPYTGPVDYLSRAYANANINQKIGYGIGLFGAPLIGEALNRGVNFLKTGRADFYSYADLQRDKADADIGSQLSNSANLGANIKFRIAQLKTGTGSSAGLKKIDAQLLQAERDRDILLGQQQRNYSQRGLPTDPKLAVQIEQANQKIKQLTDARLDIGKSLSLDQGRLVVQIDAQKALLEQFKDPKFRAALTEPVAQGREKEAQDTLEYLIKIKSEAEKAIASLRIDPVLHFINAIHDLNLAFAKGVERAELSASVAKEGIARRKVVDFSTSTTASQDAALSTQIVEQDRLRSELQNMETDYQAKQAAIAAPDLSSKLQSFGLNPSSTPSEVQNAISRSQDASQGDKDFLAQVKEVREAEQKLHDARIQETESESKLQEQRQQNALNNLQKYAADVQAINQQISDKQNISIKKQIKERQISEEKGIELLAQVNADATSRQLGATSNQLIALRNYYAQGIIGAEQFHERERELILSQSSLRKQLIEQRQQNALDGLQRYAADVQATNQQISDKQTIGIKKQLKERQISEEKGAELLAQINASATSRQLSSTNNQLAALRDYYAHGTIGVEQFHDRERELITSQSSLKKQLIEQEIATSDAAHARFLADLEQANALAAGLIDDNQAKRKTIIKSNQLNLLRRGGDQKAGELESASRNTDVDLVATRERIELAKSELAQNDLNEKNKVITARKATSERLRLNKELAADYDQLVTAQIAKEKNKQDLAIHGIEVQQLRQKNLSESAIAGIDQEKSATESLNQSLERSQKLEQSRYELRKALTEAVLAEGQIQVDRLNNALELRKKLNDKTLGYKERKETERQLRESGFNPNDSELKIIKQRQAIEDEIAARKLAALKIEQAYQRETLRLDLQRQQIAAQIASFDAESNQLKARQAVVTAKGELKKAEVGKDPDAILAARTGLELAREGLALASSQVRNAKDYLKIQPELARNAIASQQISQRATLDSAMASERNRQNTESMERVKAGGIGNSLTAEGIEMRSLGLNPRESAEDYQNRYLGLKANESMEAYQKQYLVRMPSPRTQQLEDVATNIAINVESLAGFSVFVDGLKKGNKGIEDRLDQLNTAIIALAQSPRSLHVSAPEPVTSAAKIHSDVTRQAMIAAGFA